MSDLVWPVLKGRAWVTVDTETTGLGSKDRPVGMAVAADGMDPVYLSWGHEQGGNNCSLRQVQQWAKRELTPFTKPVLMHNAPFDMRMLAYVGIACPATVEDTGAIMAVLNEHEPSFSLDALAQRYLDAKKQDDELNAYCAQHWGGPATRKAQGGRYWRAPGTLVGPYAIGDAVLTHQLYELFRPKITFEDLEDIYRLEQQQLPILLKMHMAGVRVDLAQAEKVKHQLNTEFLKVRAQWQKLGGEGFRNAAAIAPLLEKDGIVVPKTAKGNYSITKEWLEHLDHPLGQTIRNLRTLSHFAGTFIDSYLLKSVDEEGVVHGEFHPLRNDRYGTISGRYSSGGELNLQNIPARHETYAPLIRSLFVPMHQGQVWGKADYSQIEYRFFAHYAGGILRDKYVANPDIDFHQAVADLAHIERRPAKNINFGRLYGMGARKLAKQLGLSLDAAMELISKMDQAVPEMTQLYTIAMRKAAQRGFITTWGNRRRRFMTQTEAKARGWDLRDKRGTYVKTHTALNALLQGSAADLIKKAMVAVDQVLDWDSAIMHLTVHDELDFSLPANDPRWPHKIRDVMEDFQCSVPIRTDFEVGPNWGHLSAVPRRTKEAT